MQDVIPPSFFFKLLRRRTQKHAHSSFNLKIRGWTCGHERRGRTRSDGWADPQLIITTLDSNRWVCQAKVKTAPDLLRKKGQIRHSAADGASSASMRTTCYWQARLHCWSQTLRGKNGVNSETYLKSERYQSLFCRQDPEASHGLFDDICLLQVWMISCDAFPVLL